MTMNWAMISSSGMGICRIRLSPSAKRYIIIANPARLEWVPTSLLLNPSTSSPIASTAAFMSAAISELEILLDLFVFLSKK
eukprot:scaffold7028_cov40-Cyclotella_meneghiniana.AAC.3